MPRKPETCSELGNRNLFRTTGQATGGPEDKHDNIHYLAHVIACSGHLQRNFLNRRKGIADNIGLVRMFCAIESRLHLHLATGKGRGDAEVLKGNLEEAGYGLKGKKVEKMKVNAGRDE